MPNNGDLDSYRTNFLERLMRVEHENETLGKDMHALKSEMGAQSSKLDELLSMMTRADAERRAMNAKVERIEPTVQTIKDALIFANVGRRFLVGIGATIAATGATIAGALGGWQWLTQWLGTGGR